MKNYILIIITILIVMPAYSYAQTDTKYADEELAIRQVIKNIESAWAAGNGKEFADNFTDDVDYTIWNGMYSNGREANEKGHQRIFDTFFKNTKLKNEIRKIRFLSKEIAVVHVKSEIVRNSKRLKGEPAAVPLLIFQKIDGVWKAVVFQNTPVIKRGELVIGRTEK